MDIITNYIDNSTDFQKAIENLSGKKYIYIDLEFDKNHFQYGFHICLMQIYDGEGNCYLIDPLSEIDITKIFPILENPETQLVSFAFNEDMRLLHHLGAKSTNILDLAIILRLLDYDTLSMNNALATILEDNSFAKENGKQQKSNWLIRPLTEKQLLYAKEDVIYLPALKKKLLEKISELNREEWVRQEMEAFVNYDWDGDEVSNYLLHKDQINLTLREWIRFQAIMEKREELSEKMNRPSFKTIDKNIMLDIAKNPKLIKNWMNFKGINRRLKTYEIQKEFQGLLDEAELEIQENKIKENAPSLPPLSVEEKQIIREKRKRSREVKSSIFSPLKEGVKEIYGVNFANYILSNRIVDEMIAKRLQPLTYQKEIFKEINQKLGLNVIFD